ncbi:MAG: hypothetical protein U9N82_13830 [Thermodesulfobacteriota bacterium]|nr:hypothetical protein [Thermodesulfobacteriota bacterium]
MKKTDDERKPFTFDGLMEVFRSVISRFPDKRTGDNKRYALEDAALGAFSIFFSQRYRWKGVFSVVSNICLVLNCSYLFFREKSKSIPFSRNIQTFSKITGSITVSLS